MKHLSLSTLLCIIGAYSFAQSAITISSNNENVRFCVIIDDIQLHNFFETKVEVENIPAGYHYVRIVFENDTIADYYKNILFRNATSKTFLVTEKSEFTKSVRTGARAAGETLQIGEHDSTYNYLVDVYKLDYESKSSFTPSGSEMIVSTENSLSTSILPINKSKK